MDVSDALPGADLIREGLRDLDAGIESIPALLVLVGAPRLRSLGFDVPDDTPYFPEDRLYERLAAIHGDAAHSQYNALIRNLVSFERGGGMREAITDRRLREFMRAIAAEAREPGRIYLTGGASAVLRGWRDSTVDVDLTIVPANDRILRAMPDLKERLHVNVKLASPVDFVPALPGWEDRSPFIAQERVIAFHHFDFYTQCLSKLERGHRKDQADVEAMVRDGLVDPHRLRELFAQVRESLYRYPAVDVAALRHTVESFGA